MFSTRDFAITLTLIISRLLFPVLGFTLLSHSFRSVQVNTPNSPSYGNCHGTVVTAPRDVRRVLYLSSSYLAKNQLFTHFIKYFTYVTCLFLPRCYRNELSWGKNIR